ncbi:STR6 [Symbiodinium sp. CCMP2456]|nr:STR6 [Symbiodinium sp. CCMP2456]
MLAVSKPRPVKQRVLKRQPPGGCSQSLLAVARNCRECGERLTALEGALHLCPAIFEWTFPAETLGSAPSAEGPCRLVRLGANARKGAADAKLVELWENIRKTQLSHILELPSTEQLASQSASILLALRGKDVLALLSAERITADKLGRPFLASRATQTQPMLQSQKTEPLLGVALLWTRRRERRRGLAVALVDRARQLLAPGSRVAFSQPTELGQAFARQYVQRMSEQEESSVLVYVMRGIKIVLLRLLVCYLAAGQGDDDQPLTPREIFFALPPAILVRTLVSNLDASRWSIYERFTLEVIGERLKSGLAGGRPLIVEGEVCDSSMTLAGALEGFVPAADTFTAPEEELTELSEVWRFPGLRLTTGGVFSACWCRPEGQRRPDQTETPAMRVCEPAVGGLLHVVGPLELVGKDESPPEQDPESPRAPYVLDRFLLNVLGYSLEVDYDRIRVVDEDVMCGGPGSSVSSQAFLGPGVGTTAASVKPGIQVIASLGQPSTVGQLEVQDAQGYHPELRAPLEEGVDPTGENASLIWSDLATTTAGTYRVCWCSALRTNNAGENPVDLTDLFPYPPGEVNLTNATNDSNFTGWDYEFSWEDYGVVFQRQLAAAGADSAGGNRTNETNLTESDGDDMDDNDTNYSNESMLPMDGPDNQMPMTTMEDMPENVSAPLCSSDAMFNLDLGNFSIAGPTALEVIGGEGFDRRKVQVGTNFSLKVLGFGLGDGNSQRLRLVLAPLQCGQEGTFNGTDHLLGQLAEDPDAPGTGEDPNFAQTWGPLILSRSGQYYVCLCSGRGRTCSSDIDFQVEIGSVFAFWPDLRLERSGGFELRVVPHVVFSLDLIGPQLSEEDRVRIVDYDLECGHPGSEYHTDALPHT